MTFQIHNLHFSPSWPIFIIGLLALIAVGTLCVLAIKRAVRPKRTGSLEALRFLITLLVVLMLWEPEWTTVVTPEDDPEIAILWDDSKSAQTNDAQLPGSKLAISRSAFIEHVLGLDVWKQLEADGKTKVFSQAFSTPPTDTSSSQLTGTDLHSPLEETLKNHDNLRAVVMLSDGDWNLGKPPIGAAQKLLLNNVPIFSIPVGSQQRLPDIEILEVTAATDGVVGEPMQIPFSIRSSLKRDIQTTIRLKDVTTGKEVSKKVTIPAEKTLHSSLLWRLEKLGSSTLELSLPVANGELVATNNKYPFVVQGKKENLKALVIETLPRWEYRFIRNALSRDPGVELDCLLLHPKSGAGDGPNYIQQFPEKLEDLQKYDIIFLGDIGVAKGQLTLKQTTLLKQLVEEQASGIVFLPGSQGNQSTLSETPLGELIPVILDTKNPKGISENSASPLALTSQGAGSLLTMLGESEKENAQIWNQLPGFYWSAAIEKAKGGADVLATHANRRNRYGRIPLLVIQSAGHGKVLYLGHDSAWRWRRGVEDLYHYRFWGQVARWMSYQRHMAAGERVRLYYTPDRPKVGDFVTLNANAFEENGSPLSSGAVSVDITAPDGTTSSVQLSKSEGAWGAFSGRMRITAPGSWKINARVLGASAGSGVKTTIIAHGDELEKMGSPARPEVLEEMARVTKGATIAPHELQNIASLINALPVKKPVEQSIPLWAQLATMLTLIVLLALFWTLRKLNGTF